MSHVTRGNTLTLSESDQESNLNLSINYEAFETFMENSTDIKDTGRFTPNQSHRLKNTPKNHRSFSPSFIVKHSADKNSPLLRSKSRCQRKPSPPSLSDQDSHKRVEYLEKQQQM